MWIFYFSTFSSTRPTHAQPPLSVLKTIYREMADVTTGVARESRVYCRHRYAHCFVGSEGVTAPPLEGASTRVRGRLADEPRALTHAWAIDSAVV